MTVDNLIDNDGISAKRDDDLQHRRKAIMTDRHDIHCFHREGLKR